MDQQPNSAQPLIIVVAVTAGLFITAGVLFGTGIFEQLGLVPTIIILSVDVLTVGAVLLLYAFGKLGPRK